MIRHLVEGILESEKEIHFLDRTHKHIALVGKAITKLVKVFPEFPELLDRATIHDQSKFEEPERTPYVQLTWQYKCNREDKPFECLKGMQEEMNKATLHHVITNRHHPEYHLSDKSDASINVQDRDKSDKVVDASRMPALDVAEMVADWQAMSEELKKNSAREWYDKQKDVRWHFSRHQNQLIDKLLKVFEVESE